jgi:hypothetical protein
VLTTAVSAARIPQVIMIRLIHLRALQRSTITAPGTSSRK